MNFFAPIRSLLRGWFLSALGWGALALALGWQLERTLGMPWQEVLAITGRDWLVWTLVTPLIFRLAERLPIERARWKVTLPAHVALGVLLLAAIGGLAHVLGPVRTALPPGVGPPSGMLPPPPPMGWWFLGPHLPIYLAVVAGAHALCFYRRSLDREHRALELSASLAEARLRALRMQIQPHFLFNALNALAGLIPRDPAAADEMLVQLSGFLRLTLQSSGEQETPLAREFEFAERYLAVEKVRFGPRLDYAIEADADAPAALVPSLILQPLVENAVRHGIEPMLAGGNIRVCATREKNDLCLFVHDNGDGRHFGRREGVGLANTRARLRELYGPAASLRIERDGITSVEIRLPFRTSALPA